MALEQSQTTPPTNGSVNGTVNDLNRPPRLPRWTRQEILVLIQGKRVAETRVRRGSTRAHHLGGPHHHHHVEPKWASVAAYCKRHGVDRGPVQCRKRWSNLAGDFKKIKEWETQISDESDSFWVMRNDSRRERRLPGFFDREVYEILDGGVAAAEEAVTVAKEEEVGLEGLKEEEEVEVEAVAESPEEAETAIPVFAEVVAESLDKGEEAEAAMPVSEKQYHPAYQEHLDPGTTNEKQPAPNPEKGSTSREGKKRKQMSPEGSGVSNLQDQLIEIFERNNRMMTTQYESLNINCQLDRDQRKNNTESLIGVLNRLADALGRIADKL